MTYSSKLDIASPWGSYTPTRTLSSILSISNKTRGPMARMLGSGARRLVRSSGDKILDLCAGGVEFRTYPLDNRSENKFFYCNREFDHEERQFIGENLPAAGTFIDIGANAGIYSVLAAQHLNEAGRILSIEAGTEMYQRLCFNCDHNYKKLGLRCDITPVNIALSDKAEKLQLFINRKNMGSSSIVRSNDGKAESVDCLPLIDVFTQHSISKVDILKIDIEGAEYKVLTAFFCNADKELHPKCIIIEDTTAQGESPLSSLIKANGYDFFAHTRLNHIYVKKPSSSLQSAALTTC